MPLRDHFRGSVSKYTSWEAIHGGFPMVIVQFLTGKLPPGYYVEPRVHPGSFEVDVAFHEGEKYREPSRQKMPRRGNGGTAVLDWVPSKPSLKLNVDLTDFDEYEVLVYKREAEFERRLVAAIEIVSPSNKDRPESRRQFASKCAALLGKGVSVTIVDFVTSLKKNLYRELLKFIGHPPSGASPILYTATCRHNTNPSEKGLETWESTLELGKPLPIIPLWLSHQTAIPLDLEQPYEQMCGVFGLQHFD